MEPRAAVYGGHQFGHWAGRLGDGRAILLGELRTDEDTRHELQIKGGGHTLYSRFGDGRAVERSTIREFLCSEAMHALGIPTTRGLAMTSGTEPVLRERMERSATVIRVAPSFVRFGSFEWFASQADTASVRTLADYVIDAFYAECGTGEERYARFFTAVVERTAALMAHWQSVGFAHGVMNTDNFSILDSPSTTVRSVLSKRTNPASSAIIPMRRAATRSISSRRSVCGTVTHWRKR